MKKILSCLLLCAMLFSALSVGIFAEENGITADTSWYDETKTEFTLTTAAQLAGFDSLMSGAKKVDFSGKTVKLGADIDLIGYKTWQGSGTFKGIFDGQGYTISNLEISSTKNVVGMFGSASGKIQNFTLNHVSISTTASHIGAVIGSRQNATTEDLEIRNVYVLNASVSGVNNVGGIVGNANGGKKKTTVSGCSFQGIVKSTGKVETDSAGKTTYNGGVVGGIIGYGVNATIAVSDCYVNGDISASGAVDRGGLQSSGVGGIIGFTRVGTTIENCYVSGTVQNAKSDGGGLVGAISNGNVTLDKCYVNVSIGWGGNNKGGLIGVAYAESSDVSLTVRDCLVEGSNEPTTNGQTYLSGGIARLKYNSKATHTVKADFTNVIIAMTSSKEDYRALVKGDNSTFGISCDNVWYDSDLIKQDFSDKVTVTGLVDNGGKTTADLQALDLTGWTKQLYDYPIPSALIEGKTYLVGEQTKANADGTTDYRLVATWNMAPGDRLENYTDVGFIVSLTDEKNGKTLYQNQKVSCKSVYTAVSGTNAQGETITYTPDQWGGDYLFVLVLEGVEAGAQFTLRLTPYTTDTKGNDRLGWEVVKKNK